MRNERSRSRRSEARECTRFDTKRSDVKATRPSLGSAGEARAIELEPKWLRSSESHQIVDLFMLYRVEVVAGLSSGKMTDLGAGHEKIAATLSFRSYGLEGLNPIL